MSLRPELLGAHVSAAGGVDNAPGRAARLGAAVGQLFTKQPNRWAEPFPDDATIAAFRGAREQHGIHTFAAHDSYLINLASPDPALLERSYDSFHNELRRCAALGIELLVTHPGNAIDGDVERGLGQNADRIARALQEVPGRTIILLETTAGSATALGASFQEMATMIERIPGTLRSRVGVCVDTCHLWAAGYDLVGSYDDVMAELHDVIGLQRVRLFHLNDSLTPAGSRRDRHADIGEGTMGERPFRRLVTDPRCAATPMVIETPKGDDAFAADRANLQKLRGWRAEG